MSLRLLSLVISTDRVTADSRRHEKEIEAHGMTPFYL